MVLCPKRSISWYDALVRLATCVLAVLITSAASSYAADPPPLARARAFYNAADYDAAIAAAAQARMLPATADAAALVLARSHVERYRARQDAADLTAAREALRGIVRAKLTPRDQADFLVALGQLLFFGDSHGAAAEIFENALARASMLTPSDRNHLLDWWANALDREAQSRAPDRRPAVFGRLIARMEQELRDNPASAAANYWLAAALRGAGDVDRAWDAGIAAWVRTTLDPQTASAVRADLDRLMQAMVPERARQRPPREQPDAVAALRGEWEALKAQWP